MRLFSLLWLEAKYCNGNWHEEEGGNLTLLDYELRVVKDYDGNRHEGGDGCC